MVGYLNCIWWDQYIANKLRKGLEHVLWRVQWFMAVNYG
jgi:hypothetical protein